MIKVVKAIIIHKEEFLLQLRDKNKKISYPNHWSFFGGEVDKHESDEEALRRELLEEIAWQPKDFLYYKSFVDYNTNAYVKLFIINFDNISQNLILNEGQKMKWYRLEEIKKLLKTPSNMYHLLKDINIHKSF
tara:strand:- start:119 stop:517 length:399 start_codon:yes stop_codon:yes gene_type:complete